MPIRRDIIVIGGSAGAVEGLVRLMPGFPAALPARVFVTVHIPSLGSALPAILTRSGHLPGRHPADGETTEPSVVYVAPPDHHLLVKPDRVRVVQGPRENGHRPAIDPLFRSAAASYGARVICIVLSGNLNDGSAGALAVHDAGGAVVVQDPADCLHPGMPMAALASVAGATVLPLSGIARHVLELIASPAPELPAIDGHVPELTAPVADRAERGVPFVDSLNLLFSEQRASTEAALWTALRALEESAEMATRLSGRARARGNTRAGESYRHSATTYDQRARVLRDLLGAGLPLGIESERSVGTGTVAP